MIRRCVLCLPVSLLLCAIASRPAPAATQNWGDFVGDTVMYLSVTELNGEPALLFDEPSIVNDTLEFDPVNFYSEVDPGPGVDLTTSQMSMTIMAQPGYWLDNLMATELGRYSLVGLPGALGEAAVQGSFFFNVLEVNGAAVADGPAGTVSMQFTSGGGPDGGQYELPGDAGTLVPWEGKAFIDIGSAMDASRYAGQNATKVRLTFINSLSTIADANASAFIRKELIGSVSIQTNVIPEPGSVVLALLAGAPLAYVAVRRRK